MLGEIRYKQFPTHFIHVLQEVKVSNPDGVIMMRWSDVGTTSGLVDLKYVIDGEAKLGKWKISATRAGSAVSKNFQV